MNQQMQFMFCGYATKQDVYNWQIGPGYSLIFMDPAGDHIYRKSLSFGSYQPEIQDFELIRQAQPTNQPDPLIGKISTESALQQILDRLNNFETKLNDLEKQVNKPYYKKDGGKQ